MTQLTQVARQESAQTAKHSSGAVQHIPALDGLRGIAVLLVVQLHCLVLEQRTTVDQWFFRICGAGWIGVDLFFVLSGFLITGILLDLKGRPGFLRNFFGRRILRIFPLYYGFLTVYFFVLPRLGVGYLERSISTETETQAPLWLYFNFWTGLTGTRPWGVEVFWSLCVEEHFYLVWPFVVLLCNRRTLGKVCIVLIVLAFLSRVATLLAGGSMWGVYVLTPNRLDGLCIGAGISVLVRGPIPRDVLLHYAKWIGSAAGLFVLGLALGQRHYFDWVPVGSPEGLTDSRAVLTVGLTALDIAFGCLLLVVLHAKPQGILRRILEWPALREVGRYSYAMYVFHYLIRLMVRDTCYGPSQFRIVFGSQLPGQLLFSLLVISLTFFAAALSWHLYEKHFLRLKRFFEMPGPATANRRSTSVELVAVGASP
jgi:peptidoglycan/LPS O-acetylase OafA/YrhL